MWIQYNKEKEMYKGIRQMDNGTRSQRNMDRRKYNLSFVKKKLYIKK